MFKNIEFIENANLKSYSTIKIGGVAKYIVFPKNHLELKEVINVCKTNEMKFYVIGNGSNILFDDAGFDGVLISLKHFNKIKVCDNFAYVGAGINLFALNIKLKNLGLSGLEWSYGIPATLGGLVVMNGGCFEHEIGQFVEEVVVLKNCRLKKIRKEDLRFAYRSSNLKDCIILNIVLKLKKSSQEEIENKMNFYLKKKRESQPCELPSLGSVFRQVRNENETIYPAKLIDNLGMKGVKIGGVEVSQKHAGFIVNVGGATSEDYLKLVKLLKIALQKEGVFVEEEIIYLKS